MHQRPTTRHAHDRNRSPNARACSPSVANVSRVIILPSFIFPFISRLRQPCVEHVPPFAHTQCPSFHMHPYSFANRRCHSFITLKSPKKIWSLILNTRTRNPYIFGWLNCPFKLQNHAIIAQYQI